MSQEAVENCWRSKSQEGQCRGVPPFAKNAKDGAPGLRSYRGAPGGPLALFPRPSLKVLYDVDGFVNLAALYLCVCDCIKSIHGL
jgi:hypothetical protein